MKTKERGIIITSAEFIWAGAHSASTLTCRNEKKGMQLMRTANTHGAETWHLTKQYHAGKLRCLKSKRGKYD